MEICVGGMPRVKGDNNVEVGLSYYPQEMANEDIVSDNVFFDQVQEEFGLRALRGTAVAFHNPDCNLLYSTEKQFRGFLEGKNIKHAIEIGTWRGVSTALLAHYADKVTTCDLRYYPESMPVWLYFGVNGKIRCTIMEDNDSKAKVINELDFDFAFIDGDHSLEGVAYDFELVKRCGRVLFHDYGIKHCPGPSKFIESLPETELKLKRPFAYWEANGSTSK